MADQYNPSFSSPPFSSGNYSSIGSGVSISPTQITFLNGAYTHSFYPYPFTGGIFNTRASITYSYLKNPPFSGPQQYEAPIGLELIGPSGQYINLYAYVYATASVLKFRFNIYVQSLGLNYWYPAFPGYVFTTDNYTLGDTLLQIDIGPDKGANIADVTLTFTNVLHGVSQTYNVFNYDFSTNPHGWSTKFQGNGVVLAGTFYAPANVMIGNPIIVPDSILSSEMLGSPTIISSVLPVIEPRSILSEEAWGLPFLIPPKSIAPYSIGSDESFGSPTVIRTSTVESALPPPSPEDVGDIRIGYDINKQYIDFITADRDVDRDDGLETSVLLTLLTDKQADDGDDLPDDSGYRGGWFGDGLPVVPDYKMGTKLWLLQRAKSTSEIPARAKEYLDDGFAWMVEDGIVDSVEVTVERRRDLKETLAFTLAFVKPEGQTIFYRFFYNWEAQLLRRQ